MNPERYTWICPRMNCKEYIFAYTEGALKAIVEVHIDRHIRDDREQQTKRDTTSTASAVVQPRDYDVLSLTAVDIGFLKTRGISVDINVRSGLSIVPQPSKTELKQSQWAKILDRAWSKPSEGEDNGDPGIE